MARVTKKKEEKKEAAEVKTLTRAEKKSATQTLIKGVLQENARKHNDLIDEVSKIYAQKFDGEDTENINDVKGRVGSVLDIMKKDGEVLFEGGMYVLKTEKPAPTAKAVEEEKPVKKATRAKTKKKEEQIQIVEEKAQEQVKEQAPTEEKPAKKAEKKTTKKSTKALKTKEEEQTEEVEKKEPLPPAPLQPIAPVAPTTPEIAPEPIPEKEPKKEKKATRTKAKKAEVVVEKEAPSQVKETKNEPPRVALNEEIAPVKVEKEEKVEIKNPPVVKEKAEIAPKNVVDMSFLFGNVKAKDNKEEKTEKPAQKAAAEEKKIVVETQKTAAEPEKAEKQEKETVVQLPIVKQEAAKQEPVKQEPIKQEIKHPMRRAATRENVKNIRKAPERPQTADERLREAFLKRLRALGGDYFEYYSVYLLERYSMRNGRRLESLRISGGDHDGGIDGEIELTDRLGFKETIYIQAKNWDPEKGKEEYWVVGETLLQQFIGACACRQAKDGKQHCRGIFITTSRFTPEAKQILDAMSDKIVGYDGADLYEAAKECKFGLLYENGNWKLDEKLLSGVRAFFSMM